jgi:tetratricopeptide (TPR) repeat protein
VLGDDHPDTLTSINNMGSLLVAQGKLQAAEPLFREALERRRRVLGDDHPDTLTSINGLSYLLQAQGKLDQAEPLSQEAVERSRRVLRDDPRTVISIYNMGALLQAQGKLAEAEPLCREAVTRAKANKSLGPKHPNTKRFAENYAKCLDALGRHPDAAEVRKEFGLPEPTTQATTQPATRFHSATSPATPDGGSSSQN